MCILQGMLVQRKGGEGERLTKGDRNGERQTKRSKDHDKPSDKKNSLWEGYDPKKEEGENHHMIIRQEPEKPEMENTGDGTQKGGEDKEPYAKPKRRCGAWASCVRGETRIQERRSRLGSVWGGGQRAEMRGGRRERQSHKEALAGGGFGFA